MAKNSSRGGSKTNGGKAKAAKKQTAAAKPAAQKVPTIKMVAHYTLDLSFENVGAREGRGQTSAPPRTSIDIGVNAMGAEGNHHRVVMKIGAAAKAGEQTRFLVELEYVGVFEIESADKNLLHPILFIECPHQLFPFARRVLADAVRDGGHPPLLIDGVDFAGLYRQEAARLQAQRENTGEAKNTAN